MQHNIVQKIILSFHFMFSGFRLLSDRHLGCLKRAVKYRRKRSCAIIPNMAGTLIFTKSVDRYRLRRTGCTVAKKLWLPACGWRRGGRFGNWRTATTRIPSVGSEFPVYRRLLEAIQENTRTIKDCAGVCDSLRITLRRDRDSNPRSLSAQRFSRPPQSTTLPSLRGQK